MSAHERSNDTYPTSLVDPHPPSDLSSRLPLQTPRRHQRPRRSIRPSPLQLQHKPPRLPGLASPNPHRKDHRQTPRHALRFGWPQKQRHQRPRRRREQYDQHRRGAEYTLPSDEAGMGMRRGGRQLVLSTSAHGHDSIEKAAQMCRFGSEAVISVPVDPRAGAMIPEELDRRIQKAKGGEVPNRPSTSTRRPGPQASTPSIRWPRSARIARKHGVRFHIDAVHLLRVPERETVRIRAIGLDSDKSS
jgi:hypothetical protein